MNSFRVSLPATQPEAEDPLEAFIGAFDSEGSEWADQHDAYLGGSLSEATPPGPKRRPFS